MRSILTVSVCLLAFTVLACFGPPPEISQPVATIEGQPLVIEGESLGVPGPRTSMLLLGDDVIRIESTGPEVRLWEPTRVVVQPAPGTTSGFVSIITRGGIDYAKLSVFDYSWFDLPPAGSNSFPTAVTVDAQGRVWVNEQFHRRFRMIDPSTGEVHTLPIPKPPDPGPFAGLFGLGCTQVSSLGEDIVVDPDGVVWFTQGGLYLYSGPLPNHSRIVSYDPKAASGQEYRVYNVPGDGNEVVGLAWDPAEHRMWFSQVGFGPGAAIASFDPDAIPFDNEFDFSVPLDDQICQPGEPIDDCYRFYPLPIPTSQPAHLLLHEGHVWYTNFCGNSIGRLDPSTGLTREYPLPAPIGKSDPVPIVGSGPWEIRAASNGDVVFNEFFDSALGRFRIDRVDDLACLALDAKGMNPCIDQLLVPGADLRHQTLHSIAYDQKERLWFTQGSASNTPSDASIGFVTPDWQHLVLLPPLSAFPGKGVADSTGITVDPVSGNIWFAEFRRKRIGRLVPVD